MTIAKENIDKFDIKYFYHNNAEGKTKRESHNEYEIEYNSSTRDNYEIKLNDSFA